MKKALGLAIVLGMLFAGLITIADAQRQDRRRSRNRSELWDRGRERLREFTVLERYRRLWFNTSFVLGLDDAILVRAKDVYSRALLDIKTNIDHKKVAEDFAHNLRKTIGNENYEKLLVSVKSEYVSFGRRNIKIGEQGRGRRSRAREKKRESRNRGSDTYKKENLNHHNKDSDKNFKPRIWKDKLLLIPN